MEIILYHGSENIVMPEYGKGKPYNDYGSGFYCTEDLEMAKEWACSHGSDGYANAYKFELGGLSVMNLNSSRYNILNWLAILLDNRKFVAPSPVAQAAKEYLLENFLPDYGKYDIIKGYRADDSYFSFAGDFISNSLSLNDLKKAMSLGRLGEQIALKSKNAFERITPLETIFAPSSEYYQKYAFRDIKAIKNYAAIAKHGFSPDETYMLDIIRKNIKNGDACL